ncbi:MAG: hypothetical protein V3S42_03935 [Candidatus Neomarinimicrobiota bacterium]|tara:strand:+ start:164 stop:502 length:339 start_codon:yes stop_codon:yes gene_type:complete
MSNEDCSTNRFETLKESKKNPFLSNKKFEKKEPQNARWSNLSQDFDRRDNNEERSPKNSFKKRRSDFSKKPYGRHTDRYGNYKGSPFRRETRPKTPPPKEFKFEENDFPSLG